VQQAQQNYKKLLAAIVTGLVTVAAMGSSADAGIAVREAPEPLLHDDAKGPCDPQLQGPDFVPGVDVNGDPVRSADLARAASPVPAEILVPLRSRARSAHSGGTPVVALDGKALDPVLNPAPACLPARH
jgi:hypothetical protein